jgi:LysR family glycine cleavage system transcriptional activator
MTRQLPPLNAIRAFEVASRHLTLARAAEELGVTQGAISKQIIALEDFTGVQLFERTAAGLELTVAGYNLRETLTPAFAAIGEAFTRYSRRPPRALVCRISTLASFASQFLVPRLGAFEAAHPGVRLEIHTSNRLVDFSREEIDFGVRYGTGVAEGAVHTRLVDGLYIPVCHPRLLERYDGDACDLIANARRIQHSTFNEWRAWSDAAGVDLAAAGPCMVLEDYLVALKAAVTGEGVALMPEVLVRDHISRGDLVVFSPVSVESDYTFYIAQPTGGPPKPHIRDVLNWLQVEAAKG